MGRCTKVNFLVQSVIKRCPSYKPKTSKIKIVKKNIYETVNKRKNKKPLKVTPLVSGESTKFLVARDGGGKHVLEPGYHDQMIEDLMYGPIKKRFAKTLARKFKNKM